MVVVMDSLREYFLIFMIYSIMGWMVEIVYTAFVNKKFSNRGFLIGPYCPIYGVGVLLILILLSDFKDDIAVLFLLSIIVCSLLEYFTSYFMEKIFKARWWDYSRNKFNINGRICLETMIPFGLIACFVVSFLHPVIMSLLDKIPLSFLDAISLILAVVFIIDVILSFNIVNTFKSTVKSATGFTSDKTDEFNKYVKKVLADKSLFHRRLIGAFPRIQPLPRISDKIKRKIKKTKTSLH